ncbi:trifunctional uridine nucleosidase/nicotinamide riboside hydrolase/nicotinic acid riboside hydrolase [Saccharomyces eubayanus]|uniref:trifunctional uridine nucleosidase/nicotinamide riboside hydrolase/nicotinic acid riboside hydrolase n=1 Tax=Saccharomyces eubayanus TaxID=1080349 RepID=UPI0006BFEE9D|nr:URH1-like protein [Saccharomyces eubayanus]KOH01219.1 URH1-like protein [Saccharomyces eubayanus]
MTITKIPIWLDCDPGHDDAMAILLGCFHPAFELLGISTCFGNAPPENTDYNARSLLTAMGKAHAIPVYKGAQRPWRREPHYAPDIHGISGLDGTSLLPKPTFEARTDKTYIEAIEEAVLANDGEISFVSTGALTSLATVLRDKPHLKKSIKYISIMGGGLYGLGNCNPNLSAEFNVWIDPDAANAIFHDPEVKNKCIVVPLNLTHKAIATHEVNEEIFNEGDNSNLRRLFFELFQFFAHTYKDTQGFELGPPVHDPVALMPLLEFYKWDPSSLIRFDYKRMDISCIDDILNEDSGKIIIEKEYPSDGNFGTIIGLDLNIQYFWDQIFTALNKADKMSTIE